MRWNEYTSSSGSSGYEQAAPVPAVSFAIAIAILIVFLLTCRNLTVSGLISYGAFHKDLLATHELYRSVSYALLHKSPLHLTINILAMVCAGYAVEHVWGGFRFLVIFLMGTILGTPGLYASDLHFLVGASGGVYALFGTYLCLRIFRPRQYVERFPSISNAVLLIGLVLDLASVMFVKSEALGVHLLGLAVGAGCFLVFERLQPNWHRATEYLVAGVSGLLLVQAAYFAVMWSEGRAMSLARFWIEHGDATYFTMGAWMIATAETPTQDLLHEAIDVMRSRRRGTNDNDTLATLYARSGKYGEAIEIENGIVERKPGTAYISQLARFEHRHHVVNVGYQLAGSRLSVDDRATVDAMCEGRVFRRFHVNETIDISRVCPGEFALLAVRHGLNSDITVKLDRRILALPL